MWNSERAFFGPETERISGDVRDERVSAFLARVYGWMFLGLLVTGATGLSYARHGAHVELADRGV